MPQGMRRKLAKRCHLSTKVFTTITHLARQALCTVSYMFSRGYLAILRAIRSSCLVDRDEAKDISWSQTTINHWLQLGVVHNCQHNQKHTQSTLFCDPLPPSLPKEYFENVDF